MLLNRRQILRLMGISTGATLLPELAPTAAMIDAARPSVDALPALTADHPILLSDDEPGCLTLVGIMLARQNLTSVATTRSVDTLHLCRAIPVSLIVSDIMKPDMDGFEMLRRLRADRATRHIPLMFLSARIDTASAMKGMELGAVEYLPKPVLHHDLAHIVQKLLVQHGNWQPTHSDWRARLGSPLTERLNHYAPFAQVYKTEHWSVCVMGPQWWDELRSRHAAGGGSS